MRSAALLALLLAGCPPTISEPRGDAYLDAFAEGRRHYHHGRLEEAVTYLGTAAGAAERRVDRDEALYLQARAYVRLERNDEALAVLDDIARRRPVSRRTVRALYDACLLRMELGRREEALAGFREIIETWPDDGMATPAFRQIVLDYREREDVDGALAFLRGVYPRLRSSYLGDNALYTEAELLREREDRAGAREALERIVRDHPYPAGHLWDDALWDLADLDEEDGRYADAVGRLELIVSRHEHTMNPGSYTLPTMPRAQIRIARLYRDHLHDPDRAAAAYRELPRRFPHSTLRDDALFELGEMRLDAGAHDEGCRLLRRVVDDFEVGRARRRAAERLARDCEDAD